MSGEMNTPAEKLAALNEHLKGAALLSLLNIKSKPAPDALVQRVTELREVVFGLCAHLPAEDPVRATALERLKSVEALLQDPLEWHILARAQELRQDPTDPHVRAVIENAFYEEHVPRAVWQSAPTDTTAGGQAELRRSLRLPVLFDVELDAGGKRVRSQTHNLSREGGCVDVPADFAGKSLAMIVHSPTGAQIPLSGDVVWRDAGRVGVSFKIGVAEQNALDAALLAHFAGLSQAVDRWRQVSPDSPSALACAAIVGYASSPLPSSRREHLDKLAAAAQANPGAKELQLALAKLRIEERDYDGARQALKRVVAAERSDPRYRLLELTLAQRTGGGAGLGAALRHVTQNMRVPLAAISFVAVIGALVYAFVSLRGPYVTVAVPAGGLPCTKLELLPPNALCTLDGPAYQRLQPAEQKRLARSTVESLAAHDVKFLTVYAEADGAMLGFFDPNGP